MRINVKALLPRSGNNIIEGTRLAITNFLIYLIIGCLSYGLFKISNWIRHIGIPVPLPVWLILFGTGIPCFIYWFQYGKAFGTFINDRRFARGLSLGALGNLPGMAFVYILIKGDYLSVNRENFLIVFIMYTMLLILMPIMFILGTMDNQKRL
jgi:hypothetical protein